ncbi:MAG: DUF2834 domain-containing protein [Bacteroidia bacterium]|nr:DUF2834 domain-containing protein [Bacteroidia bacterium]
MKRSYLLLSILGFVLPNIFVLLESIETGNYLLYARPLETMQLMFANHVSSAFMMDLFFVLILFLIWSYRESQKLGIKKWPLVWLMTFAFGIAFGLPFFLYLREDKKTGSHDTSQDPVY